MTNGQALFAAITLTVALLGAFWGITERLVTRLLAQSEANTDRLIGQFEKRMSDRDDASEANTDRLIGQFEKRMSDRDEKLLAKLDAVDARLTARLEALDAKLSGQIENLRIEIRGERESLRAELERLASRVEQLERRAA